MVEALGPDHIGERKVNQPLDLFLRDLMYDMLKVKR